MNKKTVISILRRIDAVEAELRGCLASNSP